MKCLIENMKGNGKALGHKMMNQKRKKEDNGQTLNVSPQKKIQKTNDKISAKLENSHNAESAEHSEDLVTIASLLQIGDIDVKNGKILSETAKEIIPYLFLFEMPEDFFHLYEFCENICKGDPLNALKDLNLQLIGPYDVFREEFINGRVENKETLLRHWRYYYDPPEFQVRKL